MRKVFQTFFSVSVFFSLVLFFSLALPNDVDASAPTISSPNGGESYNVGDTVKITWSGAGSSSCSLYYITPEGGLSTAYYIGNVSNGSLGYYDWTVAVPSNVIGVQQEKIQLTCTGQPTDYSDTYFIVNPAVIPVCDKKAEVSFVNTSIQSMYRGQSISNQFAVTNPNDPSCGTTLYGLSQGYPGGWEMDMQLSVFVPAGSTVNVPVTLTASSSAVYQTYSYSVYAGDSSGGELSGATNYVSVIPRCDATVEASLQSISLNGESGSSIGNQLILKNPNPLECGAKTYTYSYGYPAGWGLSVQPNVTINSGQSVSIPFTLGISPTALVGSYGYGFIVYNSWIDGSGQATVNGTVNVLDTTAPTVTITNPTGDTVPRKSTVLFSADVSDDVGVTKVEFYVNGSLVCTDITGPYSCPFSTSVKKKTPYTLMVKAYDEAGNVTSISKSVKTK